jgi:hypothetical protein
MAEKCVNVLEQGDNDNWGDHFEKLMTEGAIFRLRLAYACHIADLLEERQFAGIYHTGGEARLALGSDRDKVPELDELTEREEMNGWLRELLSYEYISQPGAGSSARTAELLAVESGSTRVKSEAELQTARGMMQQAASYPFRMDGQHMDSITPGKENIAERVPVGVVGSVALVPTLVVVFLPLYYLFPDVPVSVRAVLPGAVFAAVGWAALAAVFGVYTSTIANTSIYGFLGAVLLVLTWFYVGALLLLVGAALNAVRSGHATGGDR